MTSSKRVPHAIIFDMDGLLVHTEPFWVQAQLEILGTLGAKIDTHSCAQTKGLRIDEVVQHYHNQHPLKGGATVADTASQIAQRVSTLFRQKGSLLPGVHHALKTAKALNVPVALSSSSPHFLIDELLIHSNIRSLFDLIVSAEDDPFGKPHPAIYIRTAELLGILPQKCIALEDSFFGLLAAKSARMNCIVVPEFPHPQWIIAEHKLASLCDLRTTHLTLKN